MILVLSRYLANDSINKLENSWFSLGCAVRPIKLNLIIIVTRPIENLNG